jgi:hypothetical protein
MKYYKLNGIVYSYDEEQVAMGLADDKTELTAEERELHIDPPKTAEQIKAHFKSMYLATVDAKLKALDYDSLATVKLWTDDATFGTEALRIITWYKSLIAMNYALENNVKDGIVPMPTDVEYQTMIDAVVF